VADGGNQRDRNSGVYLLLIRVRKPCTWRTGARSAQHKLQPGWYVYVGRAVPGLRARIGRHLSASRRSRWHVDALLDAGKVVDVQVRCTGDKADECRTAAEVRAWPGAEPVPGFGASDCRCDSHLFRFPERPFCALTTPLVQAALPEMFFFLRARYDNHALRERDPFRTLVTCILSLRTRDSVTHAAASRLFAHLRTPHDFAVADPDRIAAWIHPVGMFRQKAARLVEIARILLSEYDGRVPEDVETLALLPGVGRKTANLVRSFAYHLPAVCVDTHVHRITNRWGLVRTAAPEQTELALRRVLPESFWIETNPLLVQHGQQVCRPLRPACSRCGLRQWCRFDEICSEQRLLADLPNAPTHPSLKRWERDDLHKSTPDSAPGPFSSSF